MGAVGDDPAAVEQHDAVGEPDRREAVGDDQRRAALHQDLQPLVDLLLDLDVDRAGGVVEHQDRRVDQQRAGDRDPLALAARQRVAALADDGVVALRQRVDELVGAGGASRRPDLLERRVGAPVGDVVADRGREQERLVEHDADLGAQAVEREVAHVVAVDLDRAAGDVVEARQQPRDRRLAAGRAADHRDRLAGAQVQREVVEDQRPVAVGEADAVEADVAVAVGEVDRVGAVDDRRLLVEDLVDPLGRCRGALAEHDQHPEQLERRLEHHDVGAEGEDRADLEVTVDHEQPPTRSISASPSWGRFWTGGVNRARRSASRM